MTLHFTNQSVRTVVAEGVQIGQWLKTKVVNICHLKTGHKKKRRLNINKKRVRHKQRGATRCGQKGAQKNRK